MPSFDLGGREACSTFTTDVEGKADNAESLQWRPEQGCSSKF